MDNFVLKSPEEVAAMSKEEFSSYVEAKAKADKETMKALISAEIEEASKSNASKEDLEELQSKMDKTLENIDKSYLSMKALLEGGKNLGKEEEKTLAAELKRNMESIKNVAKGMANEFVLKADTLRANVQLNEGAFDINTVGQLATRKLSMYDAFRKIPVSGNNTNGDVRYYDWDEDTIARAAAMIAETGTFPESTAKWKRYSLPLQKVGDTLVVSEEFYEDESLFAAELEMFLDTNVALVVDDQICNGDGTGNNLKGLFASTPVFNTALATTTVSNPTIYDLLAIASEQITITGGAKYMPNVVFMRKSTINRMRLSKDANENYIIPPFVSRDGREVDSMTVIESNVVADNQLVLGDSRFGRIYEQNGISMDKGYVGTQFVEDMETLKIRRRLLFLIRTVDQTGFVKVTDIDAALVAITTT